MHNPTAISIFEDRALQITWSDGQIRRTPIVKLRSSCPCATCREKQRAQAEKPPGKTLLPVLTAAEARPLKITTMKPVGNYAYNIDFSDGHRSGLFTIELLRELGDLVTAEVPGLPNA